MITCYIKLITKICITPHDYLLDQTYHKIYITPHDYYGKLVKSPYFNYLNYDIPPSLLLLKFQHKMGSSSAKINKFFAIYY